MLQAMGWRPGRGIGTALAAAGPASAAGSASAASRSKWGTVCGVSIENTPLYVLEPKHDTHGLGFDPYEGAEVFRAAKKRKLEEQRGAGGGGFLGRGLTAAGGAAGGQAQGRTKGVAFGTGVLEDDDTLGLMLEDYVDPAAAGAKPQREMYAYEDASDSGG